MEREREREREREVERERERSVSGGGETTHSTLESNTSLKIKEECIIHTLQLYLTLPGQGI